MKRFSRKTRLILGIAAVLLSVVLSWALAGVLGNVSLIFLFFGCCVFVWLNPELMRGG